MTLLVKGVDRLHLRIPGWCKNFTVSAPCTMEKGYAIIENPPAEVTLDLSMEPTLLRAAPRFFHYTGKAAVQRGPIVYCAEGVDNPDLHSLLLDKDTDFTEEYAEEYGCKVLWADGWLPGNTAEAYSETDDCRSAVKIKFIPYFAFANRGPSDMTVWMPVT